MVAEDFLDLVEPILRGPLEERAQTVHGDCHVGNILWDGEAPFLLDFDDLTTCLPVQDLWLIAPGRGDDSQETRDSLLRGYSDFADFHDDDFSCVEALRGLRMIHYVAWIARRWQDPIFPATFINFANDRYWQEECQAIMDAAETIQGSY
jgi:Ser/Thr protein kinase RdoA (MazF antagonist)